jgi:hypothetical protein
VSRLYGLLDERTGAAELGPWGHRCKEDGLKTRDAVHRKHRRPNDKLADVAEVISSDGASVTELEIAIHNHLAEPTPPKPFLSAVKAADILHQKVFESKHSGGAGFSWRDLKPFSFGT